jgi:amino acid transporter
MVFSLVAAGCYGIEDMIPEAGPGLTLIMLMVLPFVWGLPFGLVASELGSVRPQEGGYYKWVQEALGEFWGFQAGWWRTISIYIDNTLYVVLAGGYLSGVFNVGPVMEFVFKALMILVFLVVNLRGVKDVGIVTNILSIFVIAAFAMVAIIGFTNWSGNPFEPLTAYPIEAPTDWIFYIGAGISIGMWMYSGYESMSTIAGEIEDPQVISKATLITVPLIMATYILPTMAGLGAFAGAGEAFSFMNWGSEAGLIGYSSVAEHFWGPAFGIFFGIVAIVAQCSIYNTYIASGSRGFFALADDHLSPKFLVKVDKKRGVPYFAVISVALVNLVLCMFDFSVLVVVDVFLLVASYVLVYISAMILRKRIDKKEYKFMIPGGYKFLCVLCVIPMIVAFISFLINGSDYFIGGMVGIVSGPIIYYIWKHMYGGLAKVDPDRYPVNKKTGLANGDINRISIMFIILCFIGIAGSLFLPWYEAEWAFPDDYDMTLFASKSAMYMGIRIATILCGAIGIILAIVGRKIEK